jgi:hypothetical protein
LRLIGCAHDSFLIEDTIDRIEESVAKLQAIMRQASRDLLDSFELRADCKPSDIVRYPDRFMDKREREDGMRHWNRMMALIAEEEGGQFSDHGQRSSVTAPVDRGEGEEEQAAFQGAMGEATRAVG